MTRKSYTEKWDDDWYLSLPLKMKVAWEYLCDTCDGCGFKKVSFGKMSRDIGAEITRADFDEHFSQRIHWLNQETLWVIGFVRAQYPHLTPKNKACVNIAKKVIRLLAGQQVSLKAQIVLDFLAPIANPTLEEKSTLSLVQDVDESRTDLVRTSSESRARFNKKQKENQNSSGGMQGGAAAEWRKKAAIVRQALVKFGTGTRAQAEIEEFLGPELYRVTVKAGTHKIRQVPDNEWFNRTVGEMLSFAAEALERQAGHA